MKPAASMSAAAVLFAVGSLQGGEIDPALQQLLDQTPPGATVSTLVHLSEQVDLLGLSDVLDDQKATLHLRHQVVVTELQAVAGATRGPLVAHLDDLVGEGRVESYQAFWIRNVVRVDATPDEIVKIAARDDVGVVFFNPAIENVEPVAIERPQQGGVAGGPEPGIVAVRAPEVWDQLGITGAGRLVSTLDTGIDGNHPALASRWRGLDPAYAGNPEWAWFDPVDGTTFPTPCAGNHGTHTMGTVCGGAPGNQIGVAPGAEWIHARVIDCVSIPQTVADAMSAFEWTVDPDGNPTTSFDVPDTSSNSWGLASFHGYPDCDDAFWSFLDAVEAVGVVVIFSAGNEGNSGLRRPSDRATDDYRTFAVAAVDGNVQSWPIAGFSSRGPTQCTPDGSSAIKPDISAPGVDVVSAFVGGGYGSLSGTSMSSPHINGVVAMMREANPQISVEQVKQIIFDTAVDLGDPAEDNSYGWGMVDALEAVSAALAQATLTITLPDGIPEIIDPEGGTAILMQVVEQNAEADPATATIYWRTDDGPYDSASMSDLGGNTYEGVFPALECPSIVEFYFSIDTTEGETVHNPISAPGTVYTGSAFSGVATTFEDDFESDQGWTVEDSPSLTTGTWQRGTPAGGGDAGDPASDADSSGQCFVTHNVDGDFDVDDGFTELTSPVIELTGLGNPMVEYYSWYSNNSGENPEQDRMTVYVSGDGGATWNLLESIGPGGPQAGGGWFLKQFAIFDVLDATDAFRIRFNVSDIDLPSVVEAGVDGIRIIDAGCVDECLADVDGSGDVGVTDLIEVIASWGPCEGCPADLDDDGIVGVTDLVIVIGAWGVCG